jgi:hypothetical protein
LCAHASIDAITEILAFRKKMRFATPVSDSSYTPMQGSCIACRTDAVAAAPAAVVAVAACGKFFARLSLSLG